MSEYLTLSQAAKRIPTTSGKNPSVMTIWRWITKGVNGVRLEHRRFGRRIAITPEALDAFSKELAATWETPNERKARTATTRKPKPRTAAQRERAIQAAEARLKARGAMSE